MPRKKQDPIDVQTARTIGGLLRDLRRAAGFRAVRDAASVPGCPAAQQTIYAYERGGLVPSLAQFLELVEFYVLETPSTATGAKPESDLRTMGVAAVTRVLTLPAYHVAQAHDLVARMQPELGDRP